MRKKSPTSSSSLLESALPVRDWSAIALRDFAPLSLGMAWWTRLSTSFVLPPCPKATSPAGVCLTAPVKPDDPKPTPVEAPSSTALPAVRDESSSGNSPGGRDCSDIGATRCLASPSPSALHLTADTHSQITGSLTCTPQRTRKRHAERLRSRAPNLAMPPPPSERANNSVALQSFIETRERGLFIERYRRGHLQNQARGSC
jgi:hypothetical protein